MPRSTTTLGLLLGLALPVGPVHVHAQQAPANIDPTSAAAETAVTRDLLDHTPLRGRSHEDLLFLAPEAAEAPPGQGGDLGISIAGATGVENLYLVDGLNTTDPRLGLLTTRVHPYLLREVRIVTGGFGPELGRFTGGVVSVTTKSGEDAFHGGVYYSMTPFQLAPPAIGRLGEAIAVRRQLGGEYDLGVDLGGPLWRGRAWFYLGFAPTFTTVHYERIVRLRSYDPATFMARADPSFECPGYLTAPAFCDAAGALAPLTDDGPSTSLEQRQRRYQALAKLSFRPAAGQRIDLSYLATPETYAGYSGLRGELASASVRELRQAHDVLARYAGDFADGHFGLTIAYGYHRQELSQVPEDIMRPEILYRATGLNPYSLSDFEDVPECRTQMVPGPMGKPATFVPCPVTSYQRNGFGFYEHALAQRHTALLAAVGRFRLAGAHEIALGFDFDDSLLDDDRAYSGADLNQGDPLAGHRIYRTNSTGTRLQVYRALGTLGQNGMSAEVNGLSSHVETRAYALYLREAWRPSFLPGLALDLGLRWDAQDLFGAGGNADLSIHDNLSPRVGAVYDFTRKGRSRLYVHYGRLYEPLPLNVNNRALSPEVILQNATTANCSLVAVRPGGRQVPVPVAGPGAPCTFSPYSAFGGASEQVLPGVAAPRANEVVAGFEFDVGLDVVLGVRFTHRDLENIVEDFSVDAGQNYVIGNPGSAADPALSATLDAEAAAAQAAAQARPADQQAQRDAARARARADAYRLAGAVFPRPRRDYNGVTLTASKRLSSRFALLGSYTYSRVIGNYPGPFVAYNGQLTPNLTTAYDFPELTANREGPLPTDRPHNFRLTGFYQQPLGRGAALSGGLTFRALSGRPIQVLGFDQLYGSREVFILPPGEGGRTPALTQFDLHIGYDQKLSALVRLALYIDVINLFNQQVVTNVDDEYTLSVVGPIRNGRPEDLSHLKALDGTPVIVNANYGQATEYQAPLSLRLGARLEF